MTRQNKIVLWILLLHVACEPQMLQAEEFLTPVRMSGETATVGWRQRGRQPLTQVERDEMKKLGELGTEEAISRLGWLMFERESAEVKQLGREIIYSHPDWREFLADRMASAARVQLPVESFGGDLNSLYKKTMEDQSIPLEKRNTLWSELRERFDEAERAFFGTSGFGVGKRAWLWWKVWE